jgi:hypothetical protein
MGRALSDNMGCVKNIELREEERLGIVKWAREHAIRPGSSLADVNSAINQRFFGGIGKPEWINDVLGGRKTPERNLAMDVWKQQDARRQIYAQAKNANLAANRPAIAKAASLVLQAPRSVAVFGHGIVFPVTHAGDLILRPQDWDIFVKGTYRAYRNALSSDYHLKSEAALVNDISELNPKINYDMAVRSGVRIGEKGHAIGLMANKENIDAVRSMIGLEPSKAGKAGFLQAAARSWDGLARMRYELWKKAMERHTNTAMSEKEILDVGKELGEWANNATGYGKGPLTGKVGGALGFGPALTQSKLNRVFADPVKTTNTFLNWNGATAGEKAVAWERLSGSAQYLGTYLGFLAANQAILSAFGSKEKVNLLHPYEPGWMAFRTGTGQEFGIPGMLSELKTIGKLLAVPFLDKKSLRGDTRMDVAGQLVWRYGTSKLTPTVRVPAEAIFRQDWQGRPLPWSSESGTKSKPKVSWGEYASSIGPIPLSGPTSYLSQRLRESGMSSLDRNTLIKSLILFGIGLPGFHVKEAKEPKPQTSSSRERR